MLSLIDHPIPPSPQRNLQTLIQCVPSTKLQKFLIELDFLHKKAMTIRLINNIINIFFLFLCFSKENNINKLINDFCQVPKDFFVSIKIKLYESSRATWKKRSKLLVMHAVDLLPASITSLEYILNATLLYYFLCMNVYD